MLKKVLLYMVVFTLVGATSYFLQDLLLSETESSFNPILKKAYWFHYVFSIVLVIFFQFASKSDRFFEQLGFIYLGVLVFKIMVFAALFYPQLLGEKLMPQFYRASLLLPVFIFLFLEVFFISKIMRSKKL
ncbi:DUF6168 family protein [Maribacter sp. CXY002]|uniref:DUF6168 family protein n=1 Tax=Maribacter luteocoastalis TaxID=3407671 RepID=UPI003B6793BF